MSSHNFKHSLFTQFAFVGKALSNGNRLELLEFLAQGQRSVEDLANVSGLTIGNTSQHLKLLRQAGLVTSKKVGLKVFYRLKGNNVVELYDALRKVAEQNVAEVALLVNTYLKTKDKLEPVSRRDLVSRVADGLVTIIDVRPPEEYRAGHIAGAINIPLDDLESGLESDLGRQLSKLDKHSEIIAYCRGPHCILAFDAVEKLRKKGLKVRRLEDGYPEWKVAGLPVEQINQP